MASGADVTALNKALEDWRTENSSSKSITVPLDPEVLFRVSDLIYDRPYALFDCRMVYLFLIQPCEKTRGEKTPDRRAQYQLYDRVVNVSPNLNVPLGLRGFVVGVHLFKFIESFILIIYI
jgi:hypothetical protein